METQRQGWWLFIRAYGKMFAFVAGFPAALSVILILIGWNVLEHSVVVDVINAVGKTGLPIILVALAIVVGAITTDWIIREDRAAFRGNFLANNPEFNNYEKLWRLHRLLSQGRVYVGQGQELPESERQNWIEQVETLLREWGPSQLEYYKLNLTPHSAFNYRVCKLEQTLDFFTSASR